ncbi:MAG: SMP-30/gluconolactonase/LRE family protein [Roseobacter sp.]|jgi:sugar lactone lactonase YvrE
MTTCVFDDRVCTLGEGPLWHPVRAQLFWFDILQKSLLTVEEGARESWSFEEEVSAAGWVDENTLLMASAKGLWRVDLRDGKRKRVCPLEEDNPRTRSNDGRADPFGGFWIGTMGYAAERGAGAIYRYYQGALRKLFENITIPNAICFAADRSRAYFTDTPTGKVMQVGLDSEGWPAEPPSVLVDLKPEGLNPDGAVVDAAGAIWVAQWGASRVSAYNTDGQFVRSVSLPALQVTCPAFGGDGFGTLYVTSAAEGLSKAVLAEAPQQGMTFAVDGVAKGMTEPRVLL